MHKPPLNHTKTPPPSGDDAFHLVVPLHFAKRIFPFCFSLALNAGNSAAHRFGIRSSHSASSCPFPRKRAFSLWPCSLFALIKRPTFLWSSPLLFGSHYSHPGGRLSIPAGHRRHKIPSIGLYTLKIIHETPSKYDTLPGETFDLRIELQ